MYAEKIEEGAIIRPRVRGPNKSDKEEVVKFGREKRELTVSRDHALLITKKTLIHVVLH